MLYTSLSPIIGVRQSLLMMFKLPISDQLFLVCLASCACSCSLTNN